MQVCVTADSNLGAAQWGFAWRHLQRMMPSHAETPSWAMCSFHRAHSVKHTPWLQLSSRFCHNPLRESFISITRTVSKQQHSWWKKMPLLWLCFTLKFKASVLPNVALTLINWNQCKSTSALRDLDYVSLIDSLYHVNDLLSYKWSKRPPHAFARLACFPLIHQSSHMSWIFRKCLKSLNPVHVYMIPHSRVRSLSFIKWFEWGLWRAALGTCGWNTDSDSS